MLGDQRGFDSLLAYFLDISVSDDYFLIVRLAFQKMFQGSKGYWYHPSLFGPLHKYVLFFLSLALIRCNYNSHYETITCFLQLFPWVSVCVTSLSGFEAACFLKCKGAEVCENIDARRAACRMHVREVYNMSAQC